MKIKLEWEEIIISKLADLPDNIVLTKDTREFKKKENCFFAEDTKRYFSCKKHLYTVIEDWKEILKEKLNGEKLFTRIKNGNINLIYHKQDWYILPWERDISFVQEDRYHSGTNRWEVKGDSPLRMGFEIEFNALPKNYNGGEEALRYATQQWWRYEADGSVCVEFISPILNADYALEYLKTIKPILGLKMSTQDCGWHIHISMRKESPDKLAKSLYWWLPLLFALYPKRAETSYCHRRNMYHWIKWREKYSPLYLSSYDTVEFRIFPALTNLQSAKFRIELIKFFLKYRATTFEEGFKNLMQHLDDFIKVLHITQVFRGEEKKQKLFELIFSEYKAENIEELMEIALKHKNKNYKS